MNSWKIFELEDRQEEPVLPLSVGEGGNRVDNDGKESNRTVPASDEVQRLRNEIAASKQEVAASKRLRNELAASKQRLAETKQELAETNRGLRRINRRSSLGASSVCWKSCPQWS